MRRFVLVLLCFAVIESFAADKNKYVLKTSAKVEVDVSKEIAPIFEVMTS